MKCPKCGYERTSADHAPAWQCPSCGVAYSKATSGGGAASITGAARAPTRASSLIELPTEEEKLSLAASGQKIAIYSILLTFVLNSVVRMQPMPPIVVLLLTFVLGVYSLVGIVRICSGLDKSQGTKILFMVGAFMPLVNLVSLVYLSVRATKLLRDAGWKVGLMGAKP